MFGSKSDKKSQQSPSSELSKFIVKMVGFWPKNKMEAKELENIYKKLYEIKSKNNTLEEFYVEDNKKEEAVVKSLHDRRKNKNSATQNSTTVPTTTTTTPSPTITMPSVPNDVQNINVHYPGVSSLVSSNITPPMMNPSMAHMAQYYGSLPTARPTNPVQQVSQQSMMASVVSNSPSGTKIQFAYPTSTVPPLIPFGPGHPYYEHLMRNPQQK